MVATAFRKSHQTVEVIIFRDQRSFSIVPLVPRKVASAIFLYSLLSLIVNYVNNEIFHLRPHAVVVW
jgi:hypothetical protein